MNWTQFKDPVSHMCLAGTVVSILVTYTRGGWVAGSSPFTVMTNILSVNSANSVKTFRENAVVNLPWCGGQCFVMSVNI